MWYGLPMSAEADPDLLSSASELLQSTFRKLVLVTGIAYLVWYLAIAQLPGTLGMKLVPVTVVVVIACTLALWVLSRRFLMAQAVWQVGLAAAITLAVVVSRRAEVAFSYALLPLLAAVTVSWPAGLLAESLVIALVWWLARGPFVPPLPTSYGLAIMIGGAFTGLIGWAATGTLLTVTQWSLFSFEQARRKMEQAREQRMELRQIEEDLVHANNELARLSERLRAMYQVAEEARRAKEEFVANVSHELRAPLNMITGFSEMITQSPKAYGVKLPPALLADIAVIQRNSQHLSKLVDDVLDLSQVETGRMALSKEWASLQDIIDEASLAVRPLFESKGLYLETEVVVDLPPIFCDSTRIRQVVLNLLSNAGRFTERGGVRIKAGRDKDDVVVSVADTGPGIAQEDRERIFEPFQQLDSSIGRRYGGSGLGLSISRRFVEMHGGKMWLDSEVGVGTTFYFSLPLETPFPVALASADDARRWFSPYDGYEFRARTRRSKAPTPAGIPRLVLLEDGETLRRLFDRYVDDVEVVSVKSVEEAIRELSASPARALIVNTFLSERMLASIDQLGELPYGTPVVTCWVPGEEEAAHQLGAVRYLVKPVARQTLLSTLEELGEDVRSVLLVDDELEVLQLFARMLSSADRGYRVLWAKSGERALSLLRQRQPDVMLLDLIMPGMDGFQVLNEKSQDPAIRGIPVVIVSSRDPTGEPIASNKLTIMRSRGLSLRDLLACIQTVSEILSPSAQSGRQERRETPAV